jgi:hypothetical protein
MGANIVYNIVWCLFRSSLKLELVEIWGRAASDGQHELGRILAALRGILVGEGRERTYKWTT